VEDEEIIISRFFGEDALQVFEAGASGELRALAVGESTPTMSSALTARISNAPTTTKTAGRVNPGAKRLRGEGDLGGAMVAKSKSGCIDFEVFITVRLGGLAYQFSSGTTAVPVTGGFEFS
jgi:hypothetical protein